MIRVGTVAELRGTVAAARAEGQSVGLVPTMGAFHAGHLALVRRAREHARQDAPPFGLDGPRARGRSWSRSGSWLAQDRDKSAQASGRDKPRAEPGFVVVSIFINPMQFAPHEDYDTYPRSLSGDEAMLAGLGAAAPDLIYAPSVAEMYPQPALTTVSVVELSRRLEGIARPGHFDGVCLVVNKLLNQVEPDAAFFGRKDYQQLQIIRRMVADLDLRVEVVDVPTVREADGLAMSSRNAYLAGEDRRAARCLSQALAAAVRAARAARAVGNPPDPDVLRRAALATIRSEPRARVDYVEVADPDTLAPPDESRGEIPSGSLGARGSTASARKSSSPPAAPHRGPEPATYSRLLLVAVAVQIGRTRLIDNVVVGDLDDERRLLEATS